MKYTKPCLLKHAALKFCAATLLSTCAALTHAEITLEDPWVRAMPPGQKMTAGYGVVVNAGDETVVITGASSPIAASTELHTTIKSGDSLRMMPLDHVTIQPGRKFSFTPGGPHIMLMGVSEMPSTDERVTLCLETDQGEVLCTDAPVSRGEPGPANHQQHH